MNYSKVTPEHISVFQSIIGKENVLFDEENIKNYAHDETEDLRFPPEIILKPKTSEEISKILKVCNKEMIPVTPRGAGTGLSGGALPIYGGVILAMERFNSIIAIDERNLQATVEPGVINQVFQEAVIAVSY